MSDFKVEKPHKNHFELVEKFRTEFKDLTEFTRKDLIKLITTFIHKNSGVISGDQVVLLERDILHKFIFS